MSDQPSEINRVILDKPLELRVTDPTAIPLAVAQNVAANGRLFCALLVLISLVLMLALRNAIFAPIAVLSAMPVGASCILDLMPASRVKLFASGAVYGVAGLMPFAILFAIYSLG